MNKLSSTVFVLFLFLQISIAVHAENISTPDTQNELFPNFLAENLKNKSTITEAVLKGKLTLVDFWASWCGPCKDSLPEYVELAKKYKNKNFQLIAISLDESKKDALNFVNQFKIEFPAYYESQLTLQDKLNIQAIPTSVLVNSKLQIVKKMRGYKKSHLKEIESWIQEQKSN